MKMNELTCFETQSCITKFINNQLSVEKTGAFLDHVNHCSECMEELEVYYTLFTGMKLLDEQKAIDNNLHTGFQNMLHRAEDKMIREKMRIIRKGFCFALLLTVIILFA